MPALLSPYLVDRAPSYRPSAICPSTILPIEIQIHNYTGERHVPVPDALGEGLRDDHLPLVDAGDVVLVDVDGADVV